MTLEVFVGQVIVLEEYAQPAPCSFGGVQPDVGNLLLVKAFFASIRDVRFSPIRFALGQGEEPDQRAITVREITDRGEAFYTDGLEIGLYIYRNAV